MNNITIESSTIGLDAITPDKINPAVNLSLMKIGDFHAFETTKGEGIKIAIIDTGCNVNHEFLSGKIASVRNFTTDDGGAIGNVTDYNGQGTAVAGIISSTSPDHPGVAPGAQIHILKAYGQNGGTDTMINNAIIHAINLNVDIIVTALSINGFTQDMFNNTDSAVRQNTTVIASGYTQGDANDSTDEIRYPSYFDHVIQVGASNASNVIAAFSPSNNQMDIVANGDNVTTLHYTGQLATLLGTSASAATIAGACALIKKHVQGLYGRNITHNELLAHLYKRTIDLNVSVKSQGAGMLYMTGDKILYNRELILR